MTVISQGKVYIYEEDFLSGPITKKVEVDQAELDRGTEALKQASAIFDDQQDKIRALRDMLLQILRSYKLDGPGGIRERAEKLLNEI